MPASWLLDGLSSHFSEVTGSVGRTAGSGSACPEHPVRLLRQSCTCRSRWVERRGHGALLPVLTR